MNAVTIKTPTGPMAVLLSSNDTTVGTSIADPVDVLVNPLRASNITPNTGYIPFGIGGSMVGNYAKIIPFGTSTADQTMLMSVFLVERIVGRDSTVPEQWTHHLIGAWTCTLCTKTGLSNGLVSSSQLYCDTLALTSKSATEGVTVLTNSPENNQAGFVVIDGQGADGLLVKFARNGSSASCNALFKVF